MQNGVAITGLAEVTWYPLLGQSDDMAFFISQSAEEKSSLPENVQNALIAGGFNILSSPPELYKAFMTSGVQGKNPGWATPHPEISGPYKYF